MTALPAAIQNYTTSRDATRERVLNHGGKRSGSVTESVYSWYDFAAEKRAALELWADALACIVEGRQEAIDSYSTRLSRLRGSSTVMVG